MSVKKQKQSSVCFHNNSSHMLMQYTLCSSHAFADLNISCDLLFYTSTIWWFYFVVDLIGGGSGGGGTRFLLLLPLDFHIFFWTVCLFAIVLLCFVLIGISTSLLLVCVCV